MKQRTWKRRSSRPVLPDTSSIRNRMVLVRTMIGTTPSTQRWRGSSVRKFERPHRKTFTSARPRDASIHEITVESPGLSSSKRPMRFIRRHTGEAATTAPCTVEHQLHPMHSGRPLGGKLQRANQSSPSLERLARRCLKKLWSTEQWCAESKRWRISTLTRLRSRPLSSKLSVRSKRLHRGRRLGGIDGPK
jgi:hypothetical protein